MRIEDGGAGWHDGDALRLRRKSVDEIALLEAGYREAVVHGYVCYLAPDGRPEPTERKRL